MDISDVQAYSDRMSEQDIIEEIESEFDLTDDPSWEPDLSFSGTGNDISGTFDSPGGFVIIELSLEEDHNYEIIAVSESGEDNQITWNHQSIDNWRILTNFDKGTYILDVESRTGGSWSVDFYFSAPSPQELPISKSSSGIDFIGPVNYSGFIKFEATNYDDSTMEVNLYRPDGTGVVSDQVLRLDGVGPGEESTSITKVASNQDGRTHLPWVKIRSEGKWELELEAHN